MSTLTVVVLLFGYRTSTSAAGQPWAAATSDVALGRRRAPSNSGETPSAAGATTVTGARRRDALGPGAGADDRRGRDDHRRLRRRVPHRERPGPPDRRPRSPGARAGDARRAERGHRHGQRRDGHQRGLPGVAAVARSTRRGCDDGDRGSGAAVRRPRDGHADQPGHARPARRRRRGRAAWAEVMDALREADAVFSTYRDDSFVSRLDRGEIDLADCPPEVAEVLALGEAARAAVRRRVQRPPSGPGRAARAGPQRRGEGLGRRARGRGAARAAGHRLLPVRRRRPGVPHGRPGRAGRGGSASRTRATRGRLVAVVPVRTGAVATSGTAHRGEHLVDARTGRPPAGVGVGHRGRPRR